MSNSIKYLSYDDSTLTLPNEGEEFNEFTQNVNISKFFLFFFNTASKKMLPLYIYLTIWNKIFEIVFSLHFQI